MVGSSSKHACNLTPPSPPPSLDNRRGRWEADRVCWAGTLGQPNSTKKALNARQRTSNSSLELFLSSPTFEFPRNLHSSLAQATTTFSCVNHQKPNGIRGWSDIRSSRLARILAGREQFLLGAAWTQRILWFGLQLVAVRLASPADRPVRLDVVGNGVQLC